jgi:hypothetical protein
MSRQYREAEYPIQPARIKLDVAADGHPPVPTASAYRAASDQSKADAILAGFGEVFASKASR